ncbi:hypothetical protein FRB99_004324 [Tulasnella sp. 403]|nr:hypothetical protein FRB99_004324 [Tulasnella sp. 403]
MVRGSQKHPFTTLDRRILDIQALKSIKSLYSLDQELPQYTPMCATCPSSSFTHTSYPETILLGSHTKLDLATPHLTNLKNRITIFLATRQGVPKVCVLPYIPKEVEQWARVQIKDSDGGIVNSVEGHKRQGTDVRDVSFCQYELLVDHFARNHNVQPVLDSKTFFGQLQRALMLNLPVCSAIKIHEPTTLILLLINPCNVTTVDHLNRIYEYSTLGTPEIVDADALHALVGRIQVQDTNRWAIVRWDGDIEHAFYVDDDADEGSSDGNDAQD